MPHPASNVRYGASGQITALYQRLLLAIRHLRPDLVSMGVLDRRAILTEAVSLLEYQHIWLTGRFGDNPCFGQPTQPPTDPVVSLSVLRRMSMDDFMHFLNTGILRQR